MGISRLDSTHQAISSILASSKTVAEKRAQIQSAILDILTVRDAYAAAESAGISPSEMRDQYAAQTEWYSTVQSAYESLPSTTSNPGWIQLACFTGTPSKSDVYIKAYRSIPVTEYSYITYLPSLQKTLERVSHETGDRVSVKFPRGLLGFLRHRDSLVVHFQKSENIDRINSIIDAWMLSHGITREVREGGRTELAADHSGMSFSELIAAQYAYQIVQYPEHAIGYTTFALERARSPNFIHE